MASHRIQLDPAGLLYQLNSPVEARHQVTRLMEMLRLLQDNIAQVPVVCGERLYAKLWIAYSRTAYHLYERPLEDEIRRLVRSFLGKIARVEESAMSCEAEIRSESAWAERCVEAAELLADWGASLADICEDCDDRMTTVVCDREFRLVNEPQLRVFCICNDHECDSRLDVVWEPGEVISRVGLINWTAHEVVRPPAVRYEDSGHQPTPTQKAVLEAVVSRTRLICHAGTTYFNPNVGSQDSTLRITENCGELQFRVVDGGQVVGGVFRTRASDRHSEAAIFRHIDSEFRRQLEKRRLA